MTAGDTATPIFDTPIFDTVVSEIGRRAAAGPGPDPAREDAAED